MSAYNHQSQYQPGADLITRKAGCTWTSLANGIAATTGGTHHPTPDEVHDLVARSEEQAPTTPGWSLPDAVLAASRYGIGFQDHTGEGWTAVVEAHGNRHYVLLQGDSDQFGAATCSGTYDGDHCIGIHPQSKTEGGHLYWWIDDPICPTGRWERPAVLLAYAAKLWRNIRFGLFTQPVPRPGWEVDIAPDTTFATFDVAGELITGVHFPTTPGGVHAPCSAPKVYHYQSGVKRSLVRITSGPRAGDYVNRKWAHQ